MNNLFIGFSATTERICSATFMSDKRYTNKHRPPYRNTFWNGIFRSSNLALLSRAQPTISISITSIFQVNDVAADVGESHSSLSFSRLFSFSSKQVSRSTIFLTRFVFRLYFHLVRTCLWYDIKWVDNKIKTFPNRLRQLRSSHWCINSSEVIYRVARWRPENSVRHQMRLTSYARTHPRIELNCTSKFHFSLLNPNLLDEYNRQNMLLRFVSLLTLELRVACSSPGRIQHQVDVSPNRKILSIFHLTRLWAPWHTLMFTFYPNIPERRNKNIFWPNT